MLISAVLSIHNRKTLFERALQTYLWQTLPREEWEIILVDDMSTVDLRPVYEPYLGEINLTHVRMDHTLHSLFQQRNPGWKFGMEKDWYHTPAISLNIGFALAKGKAICLCHPEILHSDTNLEMAVHRCLGEKSFLFGKTYLGDRRTNLMLEEDLEWISWGWDGLVGKINRPHPLRFWRPNELYWYTSFLPTAAARKVRGVDFEYLHGVAGEDDDFRERVVRAGYKAVYAEDLQGIHQDHSDEPEKHRDRSTKKWEEALARNRKTFYGRKNANAFPPPEEVNKGFDWTGRECIVKWDRYSLGSRLPSKEPLEIHVQ